MIFGVKLDFGDGVCKSSKVIYLDRVGSFDLVGIGEDIERVADFDVHAELFPDFSG